MSPEEVGLAAFLRPFVIVALLGVVYVLVRIGVRYLPDGELKTICEMTLRRSSERRMTKDQQPPSP